MSIELQFKLVELEQQLKHATMAYTQIRNAVHAAVIALLDEDIDEALEVLTPWAPEE